MMCRCGAWNGYNEHTGEWEGCEHLHGSDPHCGVGPVEGVVAYVEAVTGEYIVDGFGFENGRRRRLMVSCTEPGLLNEGFTNLVCTVEDDGKTDLSKVPWLVTGKDIEWHTEPDLDRAIARGVGMLELMLARRRLRPIYEAALRLGEDVEAAA